MAAVAPVTLSAVVVARDEAEMIEGCIERLRFADEIVVFIDSRTVDDTQARVEAMGVTPQLHTFTGFGALKSAAAAAAHGEWVLLVDADERVTVALAGEIRSVIGAPQADAYICSFDNYFFGRLLRHGPWREQRVCLYRRGQAEWVGDVHEQFTPRHAGMRMALLKNHLLHFNHRSLSQVLSKSWAYADLQAHAMYARGARKVSPWRLLTAMTAACGRHVMTGGAFRDGMPGLIEAILAPFATACVYIRLWELQRKRTLREQYEWLDKSLS